MYIPKPTSQTTFTLNQLFTLFSPSSPTIINDDDPMQIRLAYINSTGMVVSWNTFSALSHPTVFYGLEPDNLNYTASSNTSITYPTSTTYNNHVELENLQPDTLYYYRPQNGDSIPYTFKTSRQTGDKTPYSIAVVADLGLIGKDGLSTETGKGASHPLAPGDMNTIESLQDQGADTEFLWHSGDIGYADYWLKEAIQGFLPEASIEEGTAVYESLLNEYYDEMMPITAYKPYMVGPGNHEANCNNGGTTDKKHNITYDLSICMPGQKNFTGFRNHFRMPSKRSGGLGNFWYSFDNGMVHYVSIDTETDLGHDIIGPDEPGGADGEDSGPFGLRNAQIKWLRKDLASVDREKTPWVVVAGHRPWYINAKNTSSNVCESCRQVFEPLFLEYSVDLVLSGHIHAYQRNAPIANFNVDPNELDNPKAPLYISNGAAGHYDGLEELARPFQKYTRFALDSEYGWSRVTFHNCSHLTHEFVGSKDGRVLDSATLFKDRKC